jgi:hypothetical protein
VEKSLDTLVELVVSLNNGQRDSQVRILLSICVGTDGDHLFRTLNAQSIASGAESAPPHTPVPHHNTRSSIAPEQADHGFQQVKIVLQNMAMLGEYPSSMSVRI